MEFRRVLFRSQPPDTGISQQNVILIVYKSVLAAFSLVFCILFLFTGQRLRKVAPGHIENRIVMITWVSFISFFSQSLYFVFLAGFSSGNNAFVNSLYSLIPLWFIEILPQVVMLASQKTISTGFRNRVGDSRCIIGDSRYFLEAAIDIFHVDLR